MSDKGTHSDKQGKGSNAGKAAAGVAVIAAIVAFFSINGGQNILSGGGSGSQEQDQSAVQESTVVQEDIQIQIDTTDVYVNGEKIEYRSCSQTTPLFISSMRTVITIPIRPCSRSWTICPSKRSRSRKIRKDCFPPGPEDSVPSSSAGYPLSGRCSPAFHGSA